MLLTLSISGFAMGISGFILPLYLDFLGLSLVEMGLVFTLASCTIAFFRIFLGEYTDIFGRKLAYSSSFFLSMISSILYPFCTQVVTMTLVKVLSNVSGSIKNSLFSIMIFENERKDYTKVLSRIQGIRVLCVAGANFVAFILLSKLGFSGCFYLIASIELVIALIVTLLYRETGSIKKRKLSLREVYSFNINSNLRKITIVSIFWSFGWMINHSFIIPLYFAGKYGVSVQTIALLQGIHMLSKGVPLLYSTKLIERLGDKRSALFGLLMLSSSFLLTGLIDNIVIMLLIWLMHDAVGSSMWEPCKASMIQQFARDENRGRDVNTMLTIETLATMFSPTLSGTLARMNWDYIFLGGALFMFMAAIFFYTFFWQTSLKGVKQSPQQNE
jgi:MFS family permease